MRVAEPAIAAFGEQEFLAERREVDHQVGRVEHRRE